MNGRNMFLPYWMRYRGPEDLPDVTVMANGPARQEGRDTVFWQEEREFRVRPGEYILRTKHGECVVCRDCRDCCLSYKRDRQQCDSCCVRGAGGKQ